MNKENQTFTIRHYKEILDVVKSTKLKINEKCVIYCNSIKTMKELEKLLLAKKYLNTPLTTEDEIEELNLKNVNNKLIKWRGIKQLLQDSGYVITEKKIARNGKRIMASIISTK